MSFNTRPLRGVYVPEQGSKTPPEFPKAQGQGSRAPLPPEASVSSSAAHAQPYSEDGVCASYLVYLEDRLQFVEAVRLEGMSDRELAGLAQLLRRTARAVDKYREGRELESKASGGQGSTAPVEP